MKHVCNLGSQAGLMAHGPIIEVTLLPHQSVRDSFIAAGNLPQATVRFMVDTGADRTLVERSIAEAMGLTPLRFHPVIGVSQKAELCPVYLMTIRLGVSDDHKSGTIDFNAEVIGMDTSPIPREHHGLLGRDFLRGFHIVYNGPKGIVELHVSSQISGGGAPAPKSSKKKQ